MKVREWVVGPDCLEVPGNRFTRIQMSRKNAREHARNSRLAVLVEKMCRETTDEYLEIVLRMLLEQAEKEPM